MCWHKLKNIFNQHVNPSPLSLSLSVCWPVATTVYSKLPCPSANTSLTLLNSPPQQNFFLHLILQNKTKIKKKKLKASSNLSKLAPQPLDSKLFAHFSIRISHIRQALLNARTKFYARYRLAMCISPWQSWGSTTRSDCLTPWPISKRNFFLMFCSNKCCR